MGITTRFLHLNASGLRIRSNKFWFQIGKNLSAACWHRHPEPLKRSLQVFKMTPECRDRNRDSAFCSTSKLVTQLDFHIWMHEDLAKFCLGSNKWNFVIGNNLPAAGYMVIQDPKKDPPGPEKDTSERPDRNCDLAFFRPRDRDQNLIFTF